MIIAAAGAAVYTAGYTDWNEPALNAGENSGTVQTRRADVQRRSAGSQRAGRQGAGVSDGGAQRAAGGGIVRVCKSRARL